MTPITIRGFQKEVWNHYYLYRRDLPWRSTDNPYHIFVSEIMLQQTQVGRVIPKYQLFITTFTSFKCLACTSLRRVLEVWQGLGYNRRARALHQAAGMVVEEWDGALPQRQEDLVRLPGVGKATAGAICAFSFQEPVVFLETNIRSVFLHFFFQRRRRVADREIVPLVEKTLDTLNPREWYYALMDYGAMLKQRHANPSRRSSQYRRQSPFRGSNRELRGAIVRCLLRRGHMATSDLSRSLHISQRRLAHPIRELLKEGLLVEQRKHYMLP